MATGNLSCGRLFQMPAGSVFRAERQVSGGAPHGQAVGNLCYLVTAIYRSVNRGNPFGNESWAATATSSHDLEITTNPKGRRKTRKHSHLLVPLLSRCTSIRMKTVFTRFSKSSWRGRPQNQVRDCVTHFSIAPTRKLQATDFI